MSETWDVVSLRKAASSSLEELPSRTSATRGTRDRMEAELSRLLSSARRSLRRVRYSVPASERAMEQDTMITFSHKSCARREEREGTDMVERLLSLPV